MQIQCSNSNARLGVYILRQRTEASEGICRCGVGRDRYKSGHVCLIEYAVAPVNCSNRRSGDKNSIILNACVPDHVENTSDT